MHPKYWLFQTRPILWYFCHLVLLDNIEKHVATSIALCCFMDFQTYGNTETIITTEVLVYMYAVIISNFGHHFFPLYPEVKMNFSSKFRGTCWIWLQQNTKLPLIPNPSLDLKWYYTCTVHIYTALLDGQNFKATGSAFITKSYTCVRIIFWITYDLGVNDHATNAGGDSPIFDHLDLLDIHMWCMWRPTFPCSYMYNQTS